MAYSFLVSQPKHHFIILPVYYPKASTKKNCPLQRTNQPSNKTNTAMHYRNNTVLLMFSHHEW